MFFRNVRKYRPDCGLTTKKSASYVLMTNEMHNSYNQFLFHSFLSGLHVSNESSRSPLGARRVITIYFYVYIFRCQVVLPAHFIVPDCCVTFIQLFFDVFVFMLSFCLLGKD